MDLLKETRDLQKRVDAYNVATDPQIQAAVNAAFDAAELEEDKKAMVKKTREAENENEDASFTVETPRPYKLSDPAPDRVKNPADFLKYMEDTQAERDEANRLERQQYFERLSHTHDKDLARQKALMDLATEQREAKRREDLEAQVAKVKQEAEAKTREAEKLANGAREWNDPLIAENKALLRRLKGEK